MALNVMLVFFYQFNAGKLRRLEKYYLAFSYGLPFIPCMVYLAVERATGQRIYGDATVGDQLHIISTCLILFAALVLDRLSGRVAAHRLVLCSGLVRNALWSARSLC